MDEIVKNEKTKDKSVHEFEIITSGGKIEYLKFGEEIIDLKPIPLKKIKVFLDKVSKLRYSNPNLPVGSLEITDLLTDFICEQINKTSEWVDNNLFIGDVEEILHIILEQNKMEKWFPFLDRSSTRKRIMQAVQNLPAP